MVPELSEEVAAALRAAVKEGMEAEQPHGDRA